MGVNLPGMEVRTESVDKGGKKRKFGMDEILIHQWKLKATRINRPLT